MIRRRVGRLGQAEQASLAVACLAAAVQLFLRRAVWQAGIDRYTELLDHVRAFNTAIEGRRSRITAAETSSPKKMASATTSGRTGLDGFSVIE